MRRGIIKCLHAFLYEKKENRDKVCFFSEQNAQKILKIVRPSFSLAKQALCQHKNES